MSKIIVEDRTQEAEKTNNTFEEDYVIKYVSGFLPLVVEDGINLGLTPKEIIYSMFCIAETLKEYAKITNNHDEEEYSDVYEWSKEQAKKSAESVKASGLVEKIKDMVKEYRENKGKKDTD